MTEISQAKFEANRRNANLSTGPRTVSGKARSCLNSLRHGLAAIPSENSSEIELLSKAISGDDASPACQDHATIIAECTLMLRRVREIRLAIIEMRGVVHSMPELKRLDRYERRALSRRKRALSDIVEAKAYFQRYNSGKILRSDEAPIGVARR
jgi:hypothetical protein